MYYVDLPKLKHSTHWEINKVYDAYRKWLEQNVGKENVTWKWVRGDLCARGVFILDEEAYIIFKLKYGC